MTCMLTRADGARCLLEENHEGLCVFDAAIPPAPSFSSASPRKDSSQQTPKFVMPTASVPVPEGAHFDTQPPPPMVDAELDEILDEARLVRDGKTRSHVAAAQRMAAFLLARFDPVR